MLDMDEVLCDYDYWLDYNDARKENGKTNWNKLDRIGAAYWANMPWKLEGHRLYTMLLEYVKENPDIEIGIHSAIGLDCGKVGKRYWIEKNCPEILKKNIKLDDNGNFKYLTGKVDEILVDDRQENVDKYIEAGFPAVLFTTAKETFKNIVKILENINGTEV